MSTYDFSTLYTTLPHNLIKEKLTELIEHIFNREGALFIWLITRETPFQLLYNQNDIIYDHVKEIGTLFTIFLKTYLLDLVLNRIDKLLVSQWVLIVLVADLLLFCYERNVICLFLKRIRQTLLKRSSLFPDI